jgi:hypothetical protein
MFTPALRNFLCSYLDGETKFCSFGGIIVSLGNEREMGNFMNETLNDFKVTDRQNFINFLDLLRKDFLENPESWENKTLPDFLEALSAYTEDIQGYYENMKLNVNADKPSWQTFADIFKGAKIYE